MKIDAENLGCLRRYVESGRIVVFDTETTGMRNEDEICQIAAVEYVHGIEGRTLSEYLIPSCPMNPFAERVHGLSIDFLRQNGMAPTVGLDRFLSFLGGDVLLVAHNLNFDLRMLINDCTKYGICHVARGVETCDTLSLARFVRPDIGRYTLSNLIAALGVGGVNSHDALDDAHACAGVFFRLIGGG